jgi:glucosamine kinase
VPYYLGIDGGGTKTTSAIGDESRLLGTAAAGPSNIVRVGEVQARESLHQSVRHACAAAGVVPDQIARTCVGAAGAARPEIAEAVRRTLAEILSTPIDVVGDMQTALEAAFDTRRGVIVNAGTGSFAYGRNHNGDTARAGGWGFAIGDEGSAHWIGREAVRAILRAADELPVIPSAPVEDALRQFERTPYISALMKLWGVASIRDLARAANSIPPPDFASLFPAIAGSDDPLALPVLSNAGEELAHVAGVVIHRLFPTEDAQSVPVAMTGGVFRHAASVRETFYNKVRAADSRADVRQQIVDPVEGALRLARRAGKSR